MMNIKWKQGPIIIVALVLSSCASGPDRSNDPRSGGLFGGIKGLSQGDYDARVSQKENTLSLVKQSNDRIEVKTDSITFEQKEMQKKIAKLRPKLASLNAEISDLSRQITDLSQQKTADPSGLDELRAIVSALEIDMNDLNQEANQSSPHYEQLLAQKKLLEEEYRIAIEVFLSLDGN